MYHQQLNVLIFIAMIVAFGCKTTHITTASDSEPHRPAFHFTPKAGWMNDPNGMVYYEGEYHLFYQYFPDSTVWGPMHWGHAISTDLVHWQHLPIALYPDSLGYIFSGSAVVDWKNTSGFGINGKPPLVAMFTHHLMRGEKAGRHDFQYQSLAYSNDNGRTWTKYAGNPVIPNTKSIHDFRDTKVFWYAPDQKWVVVLAAGDHIMLYNSSNLKDWTYLSSFGKDFGAHGGLWECPDLFPLKVQGTTQEKWVLIQNINPGGPNGGSAAQYFIGDFNGKSFIPDAQLTADLPLWLDHGRDNYAGVTWSDVAAADGRRLFMGWMSNWDYAQVVPTKSWRSAMTLPRQLVLAKTAKGLRILSQPVPELQKLRTKRYVITDQEINGTLNLTEKMNIRGPLKELELELTFPDYERMDFLQGATSDFLIELSNAKGEVYRTGFNADFKQFYSDRTKAGKIDFSPKFAQESWHSAPRMSKDKHVKLHVFFDRASCELFGDNGEVVLTDIFFPNEDFTTIKLISNGRMGVKGTVWDLK